MNIRILNIYDLKVVWWTPKYHWGYDKVFYDTNHHCFNVKLFAICWTRI
ncbi:MAG TPA: hypothetical protein VMZ91_16625 [Candidatus Paceibacterota bacterium]|nr:hypothetical protein [Candidatus Paceibacterota bacterium]